MTPLICGQCGQAWDQKACGPSHAATLAQLVQQGLEMERRMATDFATFARYFFYVKPLTADEIRAEIAHLEAQSRECTNREAQRSWLMDAEVYRRVFADELKG